MIKHILAFGILAGCIFILDSKPMLAESSPAALHALVLRDTRSLIVTAVGAEANTVEVTTRGNVLIVLRANSNMNASTHEGRNNEAKAIAPIVAKAIGGKSEFKNTSTIRIQFTSRPKLTEKGKTIDSIEFRKGPDGIFDFHQS